MPRMRYLPRVCSKQVSWRRPVAANAREAYAQIDGNGREWPPMTGPLRGVQATLLTHGARALAAQAIDSDAAYTPELLIQTSDRSLDANWTCPDPPEMAVAKEAEPFPQAFAEEQGPRSRARRARDRFSGTGKHRPRLAPASGPSDYGVFSSYRPYLP
jgi:hypothetical protein